LLNIVYAYVYCCNLLRAWKTSFVQQLFLRNRIVLEAQADASAVEVCRGTCDVNSFNLISDIAFCRHGKVCLINR